ncbi:tetrahydromethanopterin S-methyltransferase subunit G [Catalinimonas alkaloidigena]|uniref:hypothetical protein n=1 Tax=Catalinimonas alkaloidigena TaxID=1075417 RepID=UPI0024074D19|nr:hypothetical protein [Catalinimonas alkaloidigena]MDF9800891.1 tetrahydromethanopterin S-methyltransferase subunit G [Catalinimonas alkaloidigena]
MTTKVKYSTDDKGERIVVMKEKTFHEIQKRLSKLEHMEKTAQAFKEIKDMKEGKLREKNAYDLLDEL